MRVELGSLTLKNPVMPGAGTFGFGHELAGELPVHRLGALVTKAVSPEPRSGNPPPRLKEVPCGVMNSVGLENPGLEVFLREILPKVKSLGPPVVVNAVGDREADYLAVAEALRGKVDALELNVSCPNVEHGTEIGTSPELIYSLTKKAVEAFGGPVWVKLTPLGVDVVKAALAAQEGGAEAVVVSNTFKALWLDDDGVFFGGLSGPAVLPVALRMVWEVSRALRVPVVGSGGITDARSARMHLRAGARAVQVGSANIRDPWTMFRIIEELEGAD